MKMVLALIAEQFKEEIFPILYRDFPQFTYATSPKQTIINTLYSIPFLPPPTTNHPADEWTRTIPITSSAAKTRAIGVTHFPAINNTDAMISKNVMIHAV